MIDKYLFKSACFALAFSMAGYRLAAQTEYMQQNFSGGGPFVNANPDAGQFSHLITTNAASSKFEFGPGFMDMTRLVATNGGLVRAVRAVPFSPNPETLYIQITFSVEQITVPDLNALYFYSGENFSGTNSTFPANASLFSRFTIDFLADSFVIHDIQTNKKSSPLPLQTPVTITWVLNNSSDGHVYKKPESAANADFKVMPRKYDLWVNETLLVDEAAAYPGSSAYTANKLSNFEIRFWTGVGRVRFTSLRIRDVAGILPLRLVYLNVKNDHGKALISWKTALQNDTDLFIVRKSTDGIKYEILDSVPALPGDETLYAVYDTGTLQGTNYYTVEQSDKYSNLLDRKEFTLLPAIAEKAFIYPNPASSNLIRIRTFGKELDLPKLYNALGQEIRFQSGSDGEVLEIKPSQTLPDGLYFLSYILNGKTEFLRFLVGN